MNEFSLNLDETEAAQIAGPSEIHLNRLEQALDVKIFSQRSGIRLQSSNSEHLQTAKRTLDSIQKAVHSGKVITDSLFNDILECSKSPNGRGSSQSFEKYLTKPLLNDKYGKPISPRTHGQSAMLDAVLKHEITLVSGPAGTGKTFLAVSVGVAMLQQKRIEKIIITRPAVESGEYLGFLPGDLKEKISPYMTPIFDALNVLIPNDKLGEMRENEEIEIAPLAYMRGRTLNNCFILLDEAQNTTVSQMKMFLTRVGVQSKVVVTGDATQKDLPKNTISGFQHAIKILRKIKAIAQIELTVKDVVRHKLVKDIINAYESHQRKR